MSGEAIVGLGATAAVLDRLDDAAREQLGVELAILGREGLALQKAATPELTGQLRSDLSLQLLINRLVVKIGLLVGGRSASRFNGRIRREQAGGPFYGRIVNFGRRAQTVLVTRRIKKRTLKGNNRRTILEGKPYKLRVKARAAVNFIDAPGPAFERDAVGQLSEYWSRVIARAETGA